MRFRDRIGDVFLEAFMKAGDRVAEASEKSFIGTVAGIVAVSALTIKLTGYDPYRNGYVSTDVEITNYVAQNKDELTQACRTEFVKANGQGPVSEEVLSECMNAEAADKLIKQVRMANMNRFTPIG